METRRRFLALITAGVMLTLGLATGAQSQERRPLTRAIEGTWRFTGTPGPNRPPNVPERIEGLATFAAGGGFIFTDDQPNPTSPTPAHGAWEFAGNGRFNATYVKFLFNPQGQFVATLTVRSKITLDFTNSEFTSEQEVEIRNRAGAILAAYDGATAVATRIRVEPVD